MYLYITKLSMYSIHKHRIKSIDGVAEIDFEEFKGRKILVVNVASECGYTPQYAQLQELYEAFSDKLVVVGCPCNDFGGQEPADEMEIKDFCQSRYGVTFPLTCKIRIKGENPHPIYQWLTSKALNGVADSEVSWNFCKYLLDEQGRLIASFPPSTYPASEEILDLIQGQE
jgi:glutathione peroxidase